ncbi:MAG: fused MFS/spermidine synthase [Solirubrobacteraceae bacterium]
MTARRAFPPIPLVIFVVGAASLGVEIAAARLLAPYFGASTVIWANTIAVVLVSLSAGYWLGGRLADRRPEMSGLCRVVLAAGGLLALVPFVARPFLDLAVGALDSISAGAFAGSLLAVLLLVALPVLLLGAASPYAVRLSVASVEESGRVAGRLYAIGTVGSLTGVFLSALLLVPLIGTQRTFLVFAAALALTGALGLGRRWALAPVAVAALLLAPPGGVKAASGSERVLQESETPYQYARVLERADGERRLELNEGVAVHSVYRPGRWLTGGYWDDFLVLPAAADGRPPRRLAILGNAAGTTARAYGHYLPATAIDAVEIDGELTRIGRRWFDLRAPRLRTHTADARAFLRAARGRFDAIFVDAYRQPYIPFHLATREFFRLCRERLAPGGSIVVNIGEPRGTDRLERVVAATLRAELGTVLRDPVDATNTLLLAGPGPASAARLTGAVSRFPRALRPLAFAVAARLGPALPGGAVYTDDVAPVEWLTDTSIVRYAAEGRARR